MQKECHMHHVIESPTRDKRPTKANEISLRTKDKSVSGPALDFWWMFFEKQNALHLWG